jgi:serine/threonine-protein kinase RsbW
MSDQVVLRLPAASAYLSVLRTATASLASRLDFNLDDIEDLRIAVDEACALLLPHASGGADLECVFDLGSDGLTVSVTVATDEPAPIAHDSFAWTVLNALVGDVTSEVTGERVTVTLAKHRAVPP